MKKTFLTIVFLCTTMVCTACDTIDAINPVVQAGKMQNSAKQATDEVTQIHNYALEEQKRTLEQLKINED